MATKNQGPTLAAFLVGNSTGVAPKPWPKEKFKEALVDTLDEFGDDHWVICEPIQNADEKRVWTVTNLAIDATEEYQMLNRSTEPESGTTEPKDQEKDKNDKNKDDSKTNSQMGSKNDAKVPMVLSSKTKFLQGILNGLTKKSVSGNMRHLEKTLSTKMVTLPKLNEKSTERISMKTPTIVMVIEGDLDTVKHVAKAVKKNIPVLLVRGSGMAADLIGYCLEEDSLYLKEHDHTLRTHALLMLGTRMAKEKSFESLKGYIKTIRDNRSKFSEFDLHTDNASILKDKITELIIRTWDISQDEGGSAATVVYEDKPDISKATVTRNSDVPSQSENMQPSNQSTKQRWWCCYGSSVSPAPTTDQVQQQSKECKQSPIAIHQMLQKAKSGEDMVEFSREFLLYALKKNRCDIIEYLVDKGVELDLAHIRVLYKQLSDERNENRQTGTTIADMIELPEEQNFPKSRHDAWKLGCNIISYGISAEQTDKDDKMMSSDLLLWAVLANKMDIAEIFWKRSPEPILTALISSALLSTMSRKADWKNEPDSENTFLKHSRVFLQRAIDVTQRLFQNNEKEALFALEQENPTTVWGIKENCLQFALEHNINQFVSHHVPQRSFERIMYGKDFIHFKELRQPAEENRGCCRFMHFKVHCVVLSFASPLAKFVYHYISFCLFLGCLSAFILTSITEEKRLPSKESAFEFCAYLWLIADIIEEYIPPAVYTFMQYKMNLQQWKRRAFNHICNFWNAIDALSYGVTIFAIGFRFGCETTDFGISRRFYSIGLFLMFMRVLQVLLIIRSTGPTVIMMKEGLKELRRFLVIMAVLVLSTGVCYHANLYPNHHGIASPLVYLSVSKIIFYPYWSIYGKFKDEIDGIDSTGTCSFDEAVYMNDPDIERCPKQDWMVEFISAVSVLILNLLFVNLIIAMFSFRFEEIKTNSDLFWRFHRSQVIMEFHKKFPVPLNVVLWPSYLIYWCIKCKGDNIRKQDDKEGRQILDEKQQILARRWIPLENDASMMQEGSRTNRK